MLKSFRHAVFLAALFVCFSSGSAQDNAQYAQFLAAISKLTPQLQTVISGGHWQRDGQEGWFRFTVGVMGFEHIRNELFLQWIHKSDGPYEPNRVVRTVPISEINGWRVTAQEFALDKKQWKIIVSAEREDLVEVTPKTKKRFFTIIPAADYTYRIVESKVRPRT